MPVAVRLLAAGWLSAALHSTGDMVLKDCGCAPGHLPRSHVGELLGEDSWQVVQLLKFRHLGWETSLSGLPSKSVKRNRSSESPPEEFVPFQVLGSTLFASRWYLKHLISLLRVSEINSPCMHLQGGFHALKQKIHKIKI